MNAALQNKQQPKWTSLTAPTPSDYYTLESDQQWLSVTWFKKFLSCEAAAHAELNGLWEPARDPTALLIGNYLHSYFESPQAHAEFVEANKSSIIAKTGINKGKPKGDFRKADKLIKTLEDDELFNNFYNGDKETIVTGKLFGQPWKGKIDCLNLDNSYFIDLKTTYRISEGYWNPERHEKVSFVDKYNYQLQMAVYQQLIKQQYGVKCMPIIFAVDKQDVPDHAGIIFDDDELANALAQIEPYVDRVVKIMKGDMEPTRCEKCEYCRGTKKLSALGFVHSDQLLE